LRRDNVRAADEIVNALNERRILLAFEASGCDGDSADRVS